MRADRPADRWLALALLLAVLAVIYLLLVHPLWIRPMAQLDEQLQAVHERQARVQAELSQREPIAQRLAQARAELGPLPGVMPQASAEQASAALVQRLEQAVAQASPGNRSCAITARSPLPDAGGSSAFVRVSVQARLRCGTPETLAVLHALESGHPRLFVDNLNILAQRYQAMPGETGAGLDVAFELVGWLDPAAASVATAGGGHAQ